MITRSSYVALVAVADADEFSPETPEEISAMVLTKETAEAYLGKKVTHAVVTVPACM
jgi:heat shock protein 5